MTQLKIKKVPARKSPTPRKSTAVKNPKFIVDQARELDKLYLKHGAWVEIRRQGAFREGRVFASCVRSAFAKLYDFNRTITRVILQQEPTEAYFLAGALRGICEDIIVLAYLKEVPNGQREALLKSLMGIEVSTNLIGQVKFFSKHRPLQRVLHPATGTDLGADVAALRALWIALGCTVGRGHTPSTHSLAKKSGLVEVYDFFYRFACEMVHFNPGVLMRFGWGSDMKRFRYSARNYNEYYQSFALVYGAFLWCLMLQVLRGHLKPPAKERLVEREIVLWLQTHERWPEMITWEEMNLDRPNRHLFDFLHTSVLRLGGSTKPIIRRRRTK